MTQRSPKDCPSCVLTYDRPAGRVNSATLPTSSTVCFSSAFITVLADSRSAGIRRKQRQDLLITSSPQNHSGRNQNGFPQDYSARDTLPFLQSHDRHLPNL